MDEEDSYEPPCCTLLRERVICEACGKRITLHCLNKYRHKCIPTEERMMGYRKAAHAQHEQQHPAIQPARGDKYADLVRW